MKLPRELKAGPDGFDPADPETLAAIGRRRWTPLSLLVERSAA